MVIINKIEEKINKKIFSKNEEALLFCAKLKQKGKIPYKYVIVEWD